jgi:hypothetical protein
MWSEGWKKPMSREARTRLLNELSRAVAAYNHAVNQLINCNGSVRPALREQVRQTREECGALRATLLEQARLQYAGLDEHIRSSHQHSGFESSF